MRVEKRDGRIENFDFSKIQRAVTKAFKGCSEIVPDKFIEQLSDEFSKIERENKDENTDIVISIETIEDTIQNMLIKKNKYCVVESYIRERDRKERKRELKSRLVKGVKEKLEAQNVQNQNANVDEHSFGGRIGEASRVVTKQMALDYYMTEMSRNNHLNNEIYIHDLDSYVVGMHNCLSIPFDDLLANGFNTRQTDVRPANSVNTAFQLIAVVFQLQSLQQFGGVSATHIDWTMVPYVRKSFFKHFKDGFKYLCEGEGIFPNFPLGGETPITSDEYKKYDKAYKYAMDMTEREVYQAVEGMYHNLNTLQSRSGNQLPFTSINYGTCTSAEGRMVTKAILEVSLNGLGVNHKTPIFPCGIFQCMKGVNRKEGEPNYDLYRLALKSTAQRLYPNYVNVDWSVNAGYDRNDPTTYCSTMGCHAAGTKIIMADGSYKNVEDIVVGDKIMGVNNETRTVQSLIRGNDTMFRVRQSRSEDYIVNEGHILALEYSANRQYKNFKKGDRVNMSVHDFMELPKSTRRFFKGYKEGYELPEKEFAIPPYILGLWLGDGAKNTTRFSVNESETQIIDDLAKYAEAIGRKLTIRQEDGEKCLSVTISDQANVNNGNTFRQGLINYGIMNDKFIPECYFYGSKRQRSALLAGLINTDGWKREDRGSCIIDFGNTNLSLINGVKRLADSLGYTTTIIKAHDERIGTGICEGCILKPYYYVSIHGFDDDNLMPNKKLFRLKNSVRNFDTSTITIEPMDKDNFYGFELDGDRLYLINDCTVTHNCRTYNGFDINGFGQKKDGRGNICPVTIILPTLAMEAKEAVFSASTDETVPESAIVDKFMEILEKKIEEARDMLIERFNWICKQPADSAKFMYENHTMAGYDGVNISSALKHGTLAMGQLGLAETLQILIGCDHTTEKGMELAKKIEQLFNTRCKEYKNEYKLNFGVYYTPAENLCKTALKNFRKKYGVIPNVSDKEFFTNSMHVPVWHDMDPFKKIDIECQLTSYSNAGCITYVELPSTAKHNIDALETLVNYAMDHDIPYFAINVPNDQCQDCGYIDEMGETCPVCGSSNIKRLRRVTGYLSSDYRNFNEGKIDEVERRVKHIKN